MIKQIAATDHSVWGELGRGRSILDSQQQLDQYLYSYGPMIKSQWDNTFPSVSLPDNNLEIIDYGCGQGLASILLFDEFTSCITNVSKITLIEPSLIALKRAKNILQCYCPEAVIVKTHKLLDDLNQNDLIFENSAIKVHLFSNILDIDGFDSFSLINKIFENEGVHYLLAVSHDRDHNGGSQRLHDIFDAVNDKKYTEEFTVIDSSINTFQCSNGQPAISFCIKVEI
jgi:hypothetical protein